MTDLKSQLRSDLTTAMKGRDELSTATLRMLLSAVTNAEVAGSAARTLTDDDVLKVVNREAKQRREAAEAFEAAGRSEQAQRERDEEQVLLRYLPTQLSAQELTDLVKAAVLESGATERRQLGLVMKAATAMIGRRADGRRVADEVRRQLGA